MPRGRLRDPELAREVGLRGVEARRAKARGQSLTPGERGKTEGPEMRRILKETGTNHLEGSNGHEKREREKEGEAHVPLRYQRSAVKTLYEIQRDEAADKRVRAECAKALLEHGRGKPAARTSGQGDGGVIIEFPAWALDPPDSSS